MSNRLPGCLSLAGRKTAIPDSAELTITDLKKAFTEIGMKDADSVVVHSSFRSLEKVGGGAKTVIQALLDVIGSRGNLMLPTFNYSRPPPEPYFDPQQTASRTGIIAETGRKWPSAVRSLSPTHSVAVIGPDAEELTGDHLACRAIGINSPIDKLARMGGKVLLIGVGNISNTTIHIGEEYAGTPKASWNDKPVFTKLKMPDGSIKSHQLDTSPSCSAGFGAVDYVLRQKGQIRDFRIGDSMLQLMHGADVIETVCQIIKAKPDILLCTWQGCKPCAGARQKLSEQGLLS